MSVRVLKVWIPLVLTATIPLLLVAVSIWSVPAPPADMVPLDSGRVGAVIANAPRLSEREFDRIQRTLNESELLKELGESSVRAATLWDPPDTAVESFKRDVGAWLQLIASGDANRYFEWATDRGYGFTRRIPFQADEQYEQLTGTAYTDEVTREELFKKLFQISLNIDGGRMRPVAVANAGSGRQLSFLRVTSDDSSITSFSYRFADGKIMFSPRELRHFVAPVSFRDLKEAADDVGIGVLDLQGLTATNDPCSLQIQAYYDPEAGAWHVFHFSMHVKSEAPTFRLSY